MNDHSLASFAAQKIWGPDQKIVSSKPLKGGMANQGVFRHELAPGKTFIQKTTTSLNEVFFSQTVMSRSTLKKQLETIPTIFDLVEKDGQYYIFMEDVGQLKESVLEKAKFAKQIGGFIGNLHKEFETIRQDYNVDRLDQSSHLDKILQIFPHKYKREEKILQELVEILKREQRVFSHNDIFIPNMGLRKESEANLSVFDFGLVGLNTPGAELHHFLDRSPPKFFNSLVDEYCLVSGFDKGLVLAGASLYSGYRQLERSKNKIDPLDRFRKLKQSVMLANQAIMV